MERDVPVAHHTISKIQMTWHNVLWAHVISSQKRWQVKKDVKSAHLVLMYLQMVLSVLRITVNLINSSTRHNHVKNAQAPIIKLLENAIKVTEPKLRWSTLLNLIQILLIIAMFTWPLKTSPSTSMKRAKISEVQLLTHSPKMESQSIPQLFHLSHNPQKEEKWCIFIKFRKMLRAHISWMSGSLIQTWTRTHFNN